MRYMLLVYTKEEELARAPQEEMEKIKSGHWAVMSETKAKGIFEAGEPLERTPTATTVRNQNGKTVVTDGPFAETKEQLAGYYILECKDLDEAISYAARIPTGCGGATGCIEVRPIRDMKAVAPAAVAQETQSA
jgi:hypothetical protein